MALMDQIHRGKAPAPRRVMLYGTHGIGKSTFAARSDRPVFIQTEDGLGEIDCDSFPLAEAYDQVIKALAELYTQDHPYRTVVVDTLDWLERMIWAEVCRKRVVESIEDIGYQKGYTFALTYWRDVIAGLDALRRDRGMTVLLVAHSQIAKFDDPEHESYDRYSPRLHKLASAVVQEWCDEVLFATYKVFAFAMPRGSGKTTLARCSALWAVLYGYRPFVCLIGAADDRAKELLLPIKKHILENMPLAADFPEAVHPLRCLENSSKRQLQQHIQGRLTHVHWGQDKLVFPTIEADHLPQALREAGLEASPSSGSIITTTSLDANMRGQQHTRVDGSIIRPSLVLLDDPQTRQSAASPTQTKRRLELLNGDVLGMAGPGEQISAVLTCTKIYDADLADQILDREKNPEWDSECTKLVYAWPTNEKLWDEYRHVRETDGHAAGTAFYRAHQESMDAGAIVAWPDRYDRRTEASAIQHAMNLKFKVGPEAFASEYQNEPVLEQVNDEVLTVEQVLAKTNGYKRGEVPLAATKVTMFIDVHDRLFYWCVCAWQEDFTGFVLDYGTFPEQRRHYYTLASATRTLGRTFPGMGADGAIHAGLERLVSTSLEREWKRGGGLMKIDRLLVDMGYKPGIVADVKRKAGGAAMMLAKGVGIRASRKPLSAYARHPGEVHGHFWYVPSVRKTGEYPHVLVDVNFWKSWPAPQNLTQSL